MTYSGRVSLVTLPAVTAPVVTAAEQGWPVKVIAAAVTASAVTTPSEITLGILLRKSKVTGRSGW